MKPLIFLLTLVLAANLPADSAASDSRDAGQTGSDTQMLLELIQAEYGLPGLAIAIADDEQVIEVAAVGNKRADHPGRIGPDSRFHLGSVSKPITSSTIGVLVDLGIVGWDDEVVELVPGWRQTARPEYFGITLRQLLSHTAGIQPFEEDDEFDAVPATRGSPRERRLAFAEWLLTLEPVAAPGTAHIYSNAGYAVAAAVVEYLLQKEFAEIVQSYLFEPLGITTAGVGPPSIDGADEPWGHAWRDDTWVATDPSSGLRIRELILPAGDFHMSLPDLARFGSAQLRCLNGFDGVLSAATCRVLHEEVMDGYALGWNVRDRFDSHLGGLEGMHTALLMIMKADNHVYAVAVNAEIDGTSSFSQLISTLRKRDAAD